MFVPNSWNVIYTVKFEEPGSDVHNDEFWIRDEALVYAKEHLEEKPVVCGVECYVDDSGTITEQSEPEEIFNYKSELVEEKVEEPKPDRLDELEAELKALAKEDDGTEQKPAEAEISEPTSETSEVAAAIEAPTAVEEPEDVDPYGFVGGTEIPATVEVEDPFACDFSDISEDEAKFSDVQEGALDPTVFLQELANELGIGDQVSITPVETPEIPDVERVELVADTTEFPEPTKDVEIKPDPVEFTLGDDLVEPTTEIVVAAEVPTDVAASLTDETPVTVAVAPEAETAAAFSEPIPDPTPCAVEAPAQNISVCTPCPECGSEVCVPVTPTVTSAPITEDVDIHVDENEVRISDDSGEEVGVIPIKPEEEVSEELTEESEFSKHQKIADKFRASLENEVSEGIDEAFDSELLSKFNIALAKAKDADKPVIYGYMSKGKYHTVEPIVCDDLMKCRSEFMKKYHPSGSLLVAYPGKTFKESCDIEAESLEQTVDQDLADDRTPVQEPQPVETEVTDANEIRAHEKIVEETPAINPDDAAADTIDSEADRHAEEEAALHEHKYLCVFDGVEVGTVTASNEEEAFAKMQTSWPHLPYSIYDGAAEVTCLDCDDDMTDIELATKLEEYKNNK